MFLAGIFLGGRYCVVIVIFRPQKLPAKSSQQKAFRSTAIVAVFELINWLANNV